MATKATCDVARFSKFQFRVQPDSPLLMATVPIADDSRVHVQLLTGWLQDLGLEVIATFDAIQAWVTALRTQPNMIILDINMPGGSGIEVLKRLKNSTKTRDIPVLVISGNAGPDIRDLVKRLGAVELLLYSSFRCDHRHSVLADSRHRRPVRISFHPDFRHGRRAACLPLSLGVYR